MTINRIQVLPEILANQIAAGEVIERPASVIKELLENSIDAGATDIRIEVEAGGSRLIRVRDDGHGIHKDDLNLALHSHATSKINQLSDLYRITSLGFRGEALSSIASVAQLMITSRTQDSSQAWQIQQDPQSGAPQLAPASHPAGTTVEVRNLFHVTPARRKFLRSERTEFLHLLEMIKRIALSRPGLNLRLLHNAKQVFDVKDHSEDHGALVRAIMGGEFSRMARTIDDSSAGMRLWGWLGAADLSRSQTDRQYFYFNGRMVRDKQINHAIRMACADLIPTGRYPTYIIYMEADPAAADINVHPTKFEIRFRNARDVHDFIFTALRAALNDERRLFNDSQTAAAASGRENYPAVASGFSQVGGLREPLNYYKKISSPGNPSAASVTPTPLGLPVAWLHGRFLITIRNDVFLLIDLHQGRRHLLRTRMQAVTESAPARQRPLLVPVSIDVTPDEADRVERYAGLISRYGLTLERQSHAALSVRYIPALLPDVDLRTLVRDVLAAIAEPVPGDLVSVFVAHACDGLGREMNTQTLQQLFQSLAETGIDMSAGDYPGIWRTLDGAALENLMAAP